VKPSLRPGAPPLGIAGRIAQTFIDSKLTPLVIVTSLLLGLAAVLMLPREEEPQIKVPMIDVLVGMPGFSAKEVEERATRPMEKLLWEIPGVEYIYSTSRPGESLVIVRFKVGEEVERSLVRLTEKLGSNFDRIPHGVSFPLIKPKSIDDVPILALTFHSERYDHLTLRRLVTQVDDAVKQVPLVAESAIIGGARRQVQVLLDPVRLASRKLSAAGLVPMLQQANRQFAAGVLTSENKEFLVETGAFLTRAADVGNVVVGVSILILLTLGLRESAIVAIAIPSTLALTLLVFFLYGFTLNRITLFALIFSIGILVDDAIVVVENIVRQFQLPHNKGRSVSAIAVEAVSEVGNPTILATFAVIAAVLPMAFVGGLMGPYMRPIPVGAGSAMFWSLAIAFTVTPWAAIRILKRNDGAMENRSDGPMANSTTVQHSQTPAPHFENLFTRLYRSVMGPLIARARLRWMFLGVITGLLLSAAALVGLGWVKVKMLPFDNKSEFQIILNMPEGSSLERTTQAAREISAAVRTEPEVTDYQIYAGTAAPFNFNGLVRHYFLRRGASVADLQINLVGKHKRQRQSHDIARSVRPRVAEIAAKYDARVTVAEVPPARRCCKHWSRKFTGPPRNRDSLWRKRCAISSGKHPVWWMWTGTWKPTSRRRSSSSTRKRPRSTASARRRFRRRCGSPSEARVSRCCMTRVKRRT